MGSGVFLLPASLAPYGATSVIAWLVSAAGALCLGLVIARLARRWPAVGGPYAWTRQAFGELPAFLVGWGYWISCWCGQAAIAIAMVGYLGELWPGALEHSGAVAIAAMGLLCAVNLRGVREAGLLQLLTTVLKVLPLIAIALFGIAHFEPAHFEPFNPSGEPLPHAVMGALALTLWAFQGFEAASITGEEVEAPEPTPSSRTEAPVDSEEPWADPTEVRAQLHGLANDLRSGNANLKDISPVAIELQGLVGDPETTLPKLVEKIEQDPKLAAAILKASNAAAYRGMPNVLDLESAGRRLGTRRLGEIAQTEALRSAFTSGVKGWSRLLSRMWRTTVVTAQTARDIAEKLGERNLGAVYTMALFHNLGEVLIIDLYQKLGYKAPRTGIADGALEREMDAQHTALGTLLLRSWRMPPSIAAIAFHHHDPGQLPAGTPVCRHAWMIGGAYRAVVEAGYEYKKTKNEGPPVAAAAAALGIKPEMFTDAAEAAIARWTGMD